jgi:CRP-like cAMP-binding protein
MGLRVLDGDQAAAIRLPAGRSALIHGAGAGSATTLEVLEGIARVFCPCEATEGMTIAFLQAGESLRTDRLCSDGVCVEAIAPLCFRQLEADPAAQGVDPVNEWTLQLLRIRHLGSAEQRLQALLALLVNRMGKRCGAWCVLPFRLTHERIGELIGTTRVTTTKLLSRLRASEQLLVPAQEPVLCLAPELIASAPLAA